MITTNIYGQYKEELLLEKYFPDSYLGYGVDVGAYDGKFYSTTLYLEEKGWSILCIEPNPYIYTDLKKNRKLTMQYAISNTKGKKEFTVFHTDLFTGMAAFSSLYPLVDTSDKDYETVQVEVATLDDCLLQANFTTLDFISIDVEGEELNVLKGSNLSKWNPKVILVENHNRDNIKIPEYLSKFGYRLDTRVSEINEFFVKE